MKILTRSSNQATSKVLTLALGVAISSVLGVGQAVAQDATNSWTLVEDWPQYPSDMQFEMGTGIAVGVDDVIYTIARVVDHWASHPLAMSKEKGKASISRWTRNGEYLGQFGEKEEFLGAHSLYIDDGGFVWVVDRDGHQVVKMTSESERVMSVGEYGVWGDDTEHFNGPTGVAFLRDGRFVVSDGYWNSRLVWFSADGTYLKEVGGLSYEPGGLVSPHAVTVHPNGNLIVANYCGTSAHDYVTVRNQISPERWERHPECEHHFDLFTQEGEYIRPYLPKSQTPGFALSAAVYGNRVYLGTGNANFGSRTRRADIVVVDAETDQIVDRIERVTVYVHQMAMDSHGDVYVASVYPEHGGEPRGIEGPSFVRWKRE